MSTSRARKTACRFVPGVKMRRTHQSGAANPHGAILYIDGKWFASFVDTTQAKAQRRATAYAREAGLCAPQRRSR